MVVVIAQIGSIDRLWYSGLNRLLLPLPPTHSEWEEGANDQSITLSTGPKAASPPPPPPPPRPNRHHDFPPPSPPFLFLESTTISLTSCLDLWPMSNVLFQPRSSPGTPCIQPLEKTYSSSLFLLLPSSTPSCRPRPCLPSVCPSRVHNVPEAATARLLRLLLTWQQSTSSSSSAGLLLLFPPPPDATADGETLSKLRQSN